MKDVIEFNREMRQKRAAVIKRAPIAMIDIGSSKISVMIAHFMPSENELAPPSFRVSAALGARSHGVQFGEIDSVHHLEADLMRLIDLAQKSAKQRVDYAMVCFSGGRPASFGATGEARVVNGEVGNSDIAAAMSNCDLAPLPEGREYLHALPINFSLDHRSGLHDPRGQVGANLAVDMHLLTVDRNVLQNIRHLIARADLELIGYSNCAFMSGMSVLTEDERELGSAVIDIGANTSSIAIFLRKQLLYVRTIDLGGAHVSADIAAGLDVPFEEAEELKKRHGGVDATAADDRETLELKGRGYDDRNYVTRAELIGIIRPRMEEIFEEVLDVLDEAGLQHLPSQRVVLTGGGAQLAGIEWLAERYFGRRLRMGKVIHLMGAPTHQTHPSFAAVTGLALHAAMPHDELWDFDTSLAAKGVPSFRNMFSWFKENW